MHQRSLQTAADAAAMAAAYEYAHGDPDAYEAAAQREAANNGFDPATDTLTIEMVEGEDGTVSFTASAASPANLYFTSMFLDSFNVGVSAEAEVQPGADGSACILALDETASKALQTSGNVGIDMPTCGIAANSDAADALYMNGSVDINVGNVHLHGDYETVGGSVDFTYTSMKTQAAPIDDPYADLEVPSYTGCSRTAKRNGTSIGAGTVSNTGTRVLCGDVSISSTSDITFEPGVYIIDGGDLKITGNGSIAGTGVTFILTNSAGTGGKYGNVDISGGRQITLSAPGSGADTEGVVFYQDRDAGEGNGANYSNSITGTADVSIDGAMYFPAREITIGGNSSATSAQTNPCSRVIGRTVKLHGNPRLTNACDDSAARDIVIPGEGAVRLVN